MYCKNCGKEVNENATACIGCGFNPLTEKNYCQHCGSATNPNQIICVKCGCSLSINKTVQKENSQKEPGFNGFINTMTNDGKIPVWVGILINAIAWLLFISTWNHAIEILMSLACVYAFFIGYKHKNRWLMYSSGFDAVWMLAWGIGAFGSL